MVWSRLTKRKNYNEKKPKAKESQPEILFCFSVHTISNILMLLEAIAHSLSTRETFLWCERKVTTIPNLWLISMAHTISLRPCAFSPLLLQFGFRLLFRKRMRFSISAGDNRTTAENRHSPLFRCFSYGLHYSSSIFDDKWLKMRDDTLWTRQHCRKYDLWSWVLRAVWLMAREWAARVYTIDWPR